MLGGLPAKVGDIQIGVIKQDPQIDPVESPNYLLNNTDRPMQHRPIATQWKLRGILHP